MRRILPLLLLGVVSCTTRPPEDPAATDRTPPPVTEGGPSPADLDQVEPADPSGPEASPGATEAVPGSLASALALLTLAEERTGGYDRDLFPHWSDADGDGCDTRCEVLAEERIASLPGLAAGGWLSVYDGYTTDDAGELDIDHLVPLAEAYESGAYAWSPERREAFANDLGEPASLVAVTAATNRSKGASDPADWQPPRTEHWCSYVADWVTVKLRWGLSVDAAELRALSNMSSRCDVSFAPPSLPPESTATGQEGYFASCAEARSLGRAPLRMGDPGYRKALDRDGDGVACE